MLRLTPALTADIHSYTTGVLRARREYELHPIHDSHTRHCADLGCPLGRAARAKEAA